MEIFGIGPMEFLLIVVIMLIVLGPKEMVNTAYKAGRLIRTIIQSPMWKSMMNASREIREMPTRLVRESGLDNEIQELRYQTRSAIDPLIQPVGLPKIDPPYPSQKPTNQPAADSDQPPADDPSI